jgi:hypothetical protein
MKKIISFCLFSSIVGISAAQISVPKVSAESVAAAATKETVKPPAIGDISGTTNDIVDALSTKLSLPAEVKPPMKETINGYLTKKKGINGLASSNPAEYASKFAPLQKGLMSGLQGILGAGSASKLLGLKPTGSGIAGNPLSHLFY